MNSALIRLRSPIVVLVCALLIGTVGFGLYLWLRPDFCDGLPREMGGCDGDRPNFSGQTCDEVALEWGRQLDERVVAVIDGSHTRRGQSQSVLLHNVETVTSQLANKHLRDSGLAPQCDVDRFFTLGEEQFSDELRSSVGPIMYQGNPVTDYEEWSGRARWWVDLILSEPDLPYDGTQA